MVKSPGSSQKIISLISGGDLRQTRGVNVLISLISNQKDFDDLFEIIGEDRLINMRIADALEKLSRNNPQWLNTHKLKILRLLSTYQEKEFLWHLVQMCSRVKWSKKEIKIVTTLLSNFLTDKNQSRIVRVSSLQALFELSMESPYIKSKLHLLANEILHENVPSLNARLKKLRLV